MLETLAPAFLIAFPHLMDDNFRQSVVLLLQHESEGATGIVVNRESSLLLSDLCRDQQIPYRGEQEKLVRTGGPVQPEQGLVLYDAVHDDPEGRGVVDGLHVSATRGTLKRLCGLAGGRFHCYSGYAGWGPDQLEREIQAGAWLVTEACAATVLETGPHEMWLACLRGLGIDPAALVPGGGETA
jgi:putative transcriptional regulator